MGHHKQLPTTTELPNAGATAQVKVKLTQAVGRVALEESTQQTLSFRRQELRHAQLGPAGNPAVSHFAHGTLI